MIRDLCADLRVLATLARGNRGPDPARRLASFYGPQAPHYDRFRERLLHGRAELLKRLEPRAGEYWAELGGGTARNLEFLGNRRETLARIDVVDLCEPLLELARGRCRNWGNTRVIRADAAHYQPERLLDGLWFSYSLSMMDNFGAVVDHARAALRPGGRIGVVDFFVSGERPPPGRVRHHILSRRLWPRWFGHDGVRVSPEIPDYLEKSFPDGRLDEFTGPLPWVPVLRVPYFIFTATVPHGAGTPQFG